MWLIYPVTFKCRQWIFPFQTGINILGGGGGGTGVVGRVVRTSSSLCWDLLGLNLLDLVRAVQNWMTPKETIYAS